MGTGCVYWCMAQQTDSDADADEVAATYEQTVDEAEADPRTVRSRTEMMVVIPRVDDAEMSIGLYDVLTNGGEYVVDPIDRLCECPDFEYNHPEDGCKHIRRVDFQLDAGILPAADEDAAEYIDALRRLHGDLSAEIGELRDRLRALEDLTTAFEREMYRGP